MAVLAMQKINIVVHQKQKGNVLSFLQDKAVLEIVDISQVNDKPDKPPVKFLDREIQIVDYNIAEVVHALEFLMPYIPKKKKSINEKLAGESVKLTRKRVMEISKSFDYKQVIERVKDIEAGIVEGRSTITKLEEKINLLQPWRSFSMSMNTVRETRDTMMLMGMIDKRDSDIVEEELLKDTPYVHFQKVSSTETSAYIAVFFLKEVQVNVRKILESFGFSETTLLESEHTPEEKLRDIEKQISITQGSVKRLENEAREISRHRDALKVIHDVLVWERDRKTAPKNFQYTDQVALIEGWIPQTYFSKFKNELEKSIKVSEVLAVNPQEDEKPPVKIRNRSFIQPFESVTGLYGLPLYSETDPTPFLSFFFIVFFGMCLSDAGYGITLFIMSVSALKFLDLDEGIRKMMKLLAYGGVFTFIMGIIYGGWFGLTTDQVPAVFTTLTASGDSFFLGQILNPVKDPITILLITVIIGFSQIWFGILVDFWWKIKHGEILNALLDSGTWLYFLASICFYVLTISGIIPSSLSDISLYMIYAGIVILVLTQGRKQKGIVAKLGIGILSLYNLVGYLSDILSYSRLLALGLATGIIALAVNIIALLMRDMIPYAGWIIMVIILIVGHAFNLGLSSLGSFIHSSRLQFVEFFGKFMEGGGKNFLPLRKVCKYIRVVGD